MAGDQLLAVVEGLSLKGFHVYRNVWKPFKGEVLLLEVEKVKIWGSYPVGALRRSDKETVGHAGIEYHSYIRRLIRLGCHCTAVVQNPKSVWLKPGGGDEIMCEYRAEGPDNQATRQILLHLLYELGKPEIQNIYKPKMTVKIKERWLTAMELEGELKPTLLPSDQSIPDEFDDPETRELFEKAMKKGYEIDRSIRVMLVGCHGQGKTTLAKRLMGEPIEQIQSTDGIEVYKCKSQEKRSSSFLRRQNSIDDTDKRIASVVHSFDTQDSDELGSTSRSNSELEDKGLRDKSVENETDNEMENEGCGSSVFGIFENSVGNMQSGSQTRVILKRKQTESGESDVYLHSNSTYNLRSKKRLKQNSELFKRVRTQLKKPDDLGLQKRNYNIWDFGGQFIYYATHQLFHSKRAVYLLVIKLSCPLDQEIKDEDNPCEMKTRMTMKDYINFWMNSIHSFVGTPDGKEPRVILVGTHRDQLKSDEEAEKYFERVKDLFADSSIRFHVERHFVFSLTDPSDQNLQDLVGAINSIGGRPEVQQKVPLKWIYLEKALQEHKSKNIISFEQLLEIDNDSILPIESEEELKLFLKYHHSRGMFFYFDEVEIGKYVVVEPNFIIDAFRSVITAKRFCQAKPDLVPLWKELLGKGILKIQLVQSVWEEKLPGCNEHILLLLLERHRIIAQVLQYSKKGGEKLKSLDFYIVPSLLTHPDGGNVEGFLGGKARTKIALVYEFDYISVVQTVFQRILAASIGTWVVVYYGPTLMVFANAGVFVLDSDHAGVISRNQNKIELLVVSLTSGKGIFQGKGDYFRRFVEFVIKNEFSKLKNELLDNLMYRKKGRCYHESHTNKGSTHLFEVDMKSECPSKKVRCPDGFSHIQQLRDMKNDWFDEEILDTDFPKRTLSSKQLHTLAQAIGEDWENLTLGVSGCKIQHIKMENQKTDMRIYHMLLQWKMQYGEEATLDVLVKALKEMPRDAVDWDIVKNIKDDFY